VAPLRLGGLRGKESTPSVWLGGTGESSTVGTEQDRMKRGTSIRRGRREHVRFHIFMVECVRVYVGLLINGRSKMACFIFWSV
jgi:hypothetical protein